MFKKFREAQAQAKLRKVQEARNIKELRESADRFGREGFTFQNFLDGNTHILESMLVSESFIEELRESHLEALKVYGRNDGYVNRKRALEPKYYPVAKEYETYIAAFREGAKEKIASFSKR